MGGCCSRNNGFQDMSPEPAEAHDSTSPNGASTSGRDGDATHAPATLGPKASANTPHSPQSPPSPHHNGDYTPPTTQFPEGYETSRCSSTGALGVVVEEPGDEAYAGPGKSTQGRDPRPVAPTPTTGQVVESVK